uniref:Uncharacterized protein n=1 Tax=Anguilla anguilla TaxID=7936 RepID=A0A0E9PTD2_ANGAN
MTQHVFNILFKPLYSIYVGNTDDLNKNDEEQGKACTVVIEDGEPVVA